eukprot:TRINITY_DN1078_c1_g1_i1.p4 TRINITY_DN1078_c1_g1~~TRINITY_DN1078_c1_g1_i1.p4  ORF type:complete len:100 (-),score=24.89 TRINITY_DN1078_c1_g1_i1:195-494(-)
MSRKLLPLFDRVLVEKMLPASKTAGGVLLPESAQPKLKEATVIAVGPGMRKEDGQHMPMSVKEGDVVVIPEFGGTKLETTEGKELFMYRETDLLGVMSP